MFLLKFKCYLIQLTPASMIFFIGKQYYKRNNIAPYKYKCMLSSNQPSETF